MIQKKQKRLAELAALAVIGVVLWWSTKKIVMWTSEREPLEITCADFRSSHIEAHWVRLTHCDADLGHMVVQRDAGGGKVNVVYIPLHPEGSTVPAVVMLERDDADLIAVVTTDEDLLRRQVHIPVPRIGLSAGPSPAEEEPAKVDPRAQRITAELHAPLQGLITEPEERANLLDMNVGLDSGFVLLRAGGTPSPLAGIAGLVFALIAAGWIVWDLLRRPGSEPKPKYDKRLSLNLR